ncbi:PadR family transcriptional regulator [Novosphingobium sp. KCTC 2891]|uniref:PadR family transcriptional regulator n=1 Tax=Novosphingobium sp. KCTC 2891 TaxID=2989730 RepID=UPI002221D624|nr:PadR family transcriptional regulator [Novosphingobium sp. KCTC 2891]MCW1381524.1 PadR family transcriptional regulator [Novosphingobium sp. KCTC 2891]
MRFDMRGYGRGHPGWGMKMMRHGAFASRFGGYDDSDGEGFGAGFGGGFGGGRHGGGHGRRGGGRGGRMFAPGELRLFLLHLVGQQNRHGYELIKAIEELTGGHYAPSPGVVYPTLALLVDEAMIAEVPGEGARKAFAVTDGGRAELATRGAEIAAIRARLEGIAEVRGREASPPVIRAMTNLKLALRQRAMAGGLETETAHQIADILDEAARRIERL